MALDENSYAKGIKVTDAELATLAIERDEFHGEWNYRLLPRTEPHAQTRLFKLFLLNALDQCDFGELALADLNHVGAGV